MLRLAYTLAILAITGWASQAAECNRPEYDAAEKWIGPCADLGVEWLACGDLFATAKAHVDWVLFEDTAALEVYRASVKEQLACGYPSTSITYLRAVTVAAKAHDPQAQCVILNCSFKVDFYLEDLKDQGKLPTE